MSDLPKRVEIHEEGPREGFQIEPGPISTADKIALIEALSLTGLAHVQIASFVTGGIIDAKFFGVLAMFGAIAVMALVPWLDTSSVRSGRYRPMFKWWFALLVIDFFALMWLGAMPAEEPYASFSLIASAYWFAYFLVILPLLGVIEKPAPQPETIEADFDAHYAPKTGGTKTLVKPAE